MKVALVSACLVTMVQGAVAFSAESNELPSEAIAAMIALVEKGDLETLVEERSSQFARLPERMPPPIRSKIRGTEVAHLTKHRESLLQSLSAAKQKLEEMANDESVKNLMDGLQEVECKVDKPPYNGIDFTKKDGKWQFKLWTTKKKNDDGSVEYGLDP